MDVKKRFELIKSVGEEVVTEKELRELLEKKKNPIAYDGFEPSGNVHIAQGVMRAINVNKMTKAGVKFKMLVADWHAMANNKMGGDLDVIQKVGKYLIEVWRVSGMDLSKVEFVWANDLVNNRDYWKSVVQVGRASTVKRIIRCSQIMGRKEDESLSAAQVVYPLMQCTDIFHLGADITQLGMDQRKVNMLAREIGPGLGYWKPIVVSHHMLMGLGRPVSSEKEVADRVMDLKMSKSKPDTAIFMNDTEAEIKRKISKAWCPEKQIHENPVLEYCKYIVFERFDKVKIERSKKWGGDTEFKSYNELEKCFARGEVHPLDLKKAVARYINDLVEPVRKHFERNRKAKELYEFVKKQEITR
jgi:tyrosyl-tRNA synthetase